MRKRMWTGVRDQVTLLYGGELTERCKPTLMEKIKIILKMKKIKKKKTTQVSRRTRAGSPSWQHPPPSL